ncbi:UvrD-like helicase, ATP-binding domain, P-loop containing nucleoside triphosphate hydrolase [Tanacetum coccineum]
MATMCFDKAGDTLWETLAKASSLRASAYRMLETNDEAFEGYVREAARMFESIGKIEHAASCYSDLKEYERADLQIIKPIKSSVTSLCVTSNDNIIVGCSDGMIRKIDMRLLSSDIFSFEVEFMIFLGKKHNVDYTLVMRYEFMIDDTVDHRI